MQYFSGKSYGLPDTVRVHPWANLVGQIECGDYVRIDPFVTITGKVRLGDRVHIGCNVSIFGTEGVLIGDGSSISAGVRIFTGSDDIMTEYMSNPQLVERNVRCGKVTIGSFTEVGANSVILPGVWIGDECVIGALSVVKRDVPDREVWAGIPAHYLCPRTKIDRDAAMGYVT